jgi:hypothetical protein
VSGAIEYSLEQDITKHIKEYFSMNALVVHLMLMLLLLAAMRSSPSEKVIPL